jgi:hypothetical protein
VHARRTRGAFPSQDDSTSTRTASSVVGPCYVMLLLLRYCVCCLLRHCLHCSLRYCLCCGTAFTAYCIHCVTDPPPKRPAPACRSVRASADDKIVENEEVAPRVTPVAAARRSRPYPRAHPLLRIGDPSPYAPSPALPSVDPTVRRSYPLSFYKPKHDPEALVAIGTSLAGAQTTPPETSLSSPKRKKLQKPPISSTFTNIPSA